MIVQALNVECIIVYKQDPLGERIIIRGIGRFIVIMIIIITIIIAKFIVLDSKMNPHSNYFPLKTNQKK